MLPSDAIDAFDRWQTGRKEWNRRDLNAASQTRIFFFDNEGDFVSQHLCRDDDPGNLIDAIEEANLRKATSFAVMQNEIDDRGALLLKDTMNDRQRSTLKRFRFAGEQLNLKMIDYMLISNDAYYSAAENGFTALEAF